MLERNEVVFASLAKPGHCLQGRKTIYTNYRQITEDNIISVINSAIAVHNANKADITYLYNVYKGIQDVLAKEKIVRPEINNKVVINAANSIVTFKTGYLLAGPIQYVSMGKGEEISESVTKLNEFMRSEDKESKDKELADWIHIGGVGVRMVLPDTMGVAYGSPVDIYIPDPREAFVIYYSGLGHRPLVGVVIQTDEDGKEYYSAYTDKFYCEIQGNKFKMRPTPHFLQQVPIIEYQNNMARLGAFEIVLPILNQINDIESNRADSIQDFVNAFDVFQNCEVDDKTYRNLSGGGKAINVKTVVAGMEAKVYRVSSEMNQSGAQTEIDNLTEKYLTICGMPNRNGGSSTSDTGQAVIYRDGWSEAESRAKDTETSWKRSEHEFLRLVLHICNNSANDEDRLGLKLSDIKTEFTRKNFAGLQSKVQVLCQMLQTEKIHPKLAWEISTVVADSEYAYQLSNDYRNDQMKLNEEKEAKAMAAANNAAAGTTPPGDDPALEE